MRISKRMLRCLKTAVLNSFGEVPVYLFGSRVDDNAIGGDIDLAMDINLDRETFRNKRAQFKAELLKLGLTDIATDVVSYKPKDELLAREIGENSKHLF